MQLVVNSPGTSFSIQLLAPIRINLIPQEKP